MCEGESISVHLNKLTETVSEMKSSGEAPSDKEVIAAIFNSLPKFSLSQIAVSQAQKDLTVKFVIFSLKEEGGRREATSKTSVLRVKPGNKEIVCFQCKKHMARNCRSKGVQEQKATCTHSPTERTTPRGHRRGNFKYNKKSDERQMFAIGETNSNLKNHWFTRLRICLVKNKDQVLETKIKVMLQQLKTNLAKLQRPYLQTVAEYSGGEFQWFMEHEGIE